jgi:hypothetical protein
MQVSAAFELDVIPALSIPERILLFCVASDTDWMHAGDDRERRRTT